MPTLGELTTLKYTKDGEEKWVHIIEEASHKWKDIVCLINTSSNRVSILQEKHRGDSKGCLRQSLTEDFIDKKPEKYSHNWRGLMELLNSVDLPVLAERVKYALLCT